ncbi:hypothetical protein P3S67_017023 [Capsicum chacoense]
MSKMKFSGGQFQGRCLQPQSEHCRVNRVIEAQEMEFLNRNCRASDKCQREKRKTINGDDLLWAMATLGFEDYI